jgi:hypothetical protein
MRSREEEMSETSEPAEDGRSAEHTGRTITRRDEDCPSRATANRAEKKLGEIQSTMCGK